MLKVALALHVLVGILAVAQGTWQRSSSLIDYLWDSDFRRLTDSLEYEYIYYNWPKVGLIA